MNIYIFPEFAGITQDFVIFSRIRLDFLELSRISQDFLEFPKNCPELANITWNKKRTVILIQAIIVIVYEITPTTCAMNSNMIIIPKIT